MIRRFLCKIGFHNSEEYKPEYRKGIKGYCSRGGLIYYKCISCGFKWEEIWKSF